VHSELPIYFIRRHHPLPLANTITRADGVPCVTVLWLREWSFLLFLTKKNRHCSSTLAAISLKSLNGIMVGALKSTEFTSFSERISCCTGSTMSCWWVALFFSYYR
jgi:hypothetical protein